MADAAINALTAPDNTYTAASTIDGGRELSHILVDVFNQPIMRELKIIPPGQAASNAYWTGIPVRQDPGNRTIDRGRICGIRFWAFTPAAQLPAGAPQAVVTVEAVALNG